MIISGVVRYEADSWVKDEYTRKGERDKVSTRKKHPGGYVPLQKKHPGGVCLALEEVAVLVRITHDLVPDLHADQARGYDGLRLG